MTEQQQKEQFSFAYVRAIAAAARVNVSRAEVDDDSVDISFSVKSVAGKPISPRLDAQLKCVTELVSRGNFFHYPLKTKNYNELVGKHHVPRILIVVLIPPLVSDWIKQSEQCLSLYKCGYWVSLDNFPQSPNTSSVTVEISRNSVFSPVALSSLLSQGAST